MINTILQSYNLSSETQIKTTIHLEPLSLGNYLNKNIHNSKDKIIYMLFTRGKNKNHVIANYELVLQSRVRNLAGKSEADLRRGGSHRHAVPTDAALAHLMGMTVRMMTTAVKAREGVRDLTGYVPRQRCDQHQAHQGARNNHDKAAAEVPTAHEPVGFDDGDQRHVDRRQVADDRVGYSHKEGRIRGKRSTKQ
ncbi:hypothetical protein QN277_014643 [Acacia crassicarpa]|uniref:Uncharacterized protein n=1 Tax=Acacia crassicarpa TaxID=499986 RepID=A0AAE1MQC9_9FABA|nr:hypothetical protein QN277_014643 [Acacia crassicarpa]